MKKVLLLLILVSSFCYAKAQALVTEKETCIAAINYATQYLNYNNVNLTDIASIYNHQDSGVLIMREVRIKSGPTIVFSTNKACVPVLFYSTDTMSILQNTEYLPGGLMDFIDNYTLAIKESFNSPIESYNEKWDDLLNPSCIEKNITSSIYGPLITTKWGQSESNDNIDCNAYNHYVTVTNSHCLCDANNQKAPTGCVATAMAQIMNYWKHPVYMPDSIEQYDWCNMPDELRQNIVYTSLPNPNYTIERHAVAKLMKDCGTAADMNYGFLNGCQSFAWPIDARNALVDVFDYNSNADRKLRSSYSTQTWKQMLIGNIQMGDRSFMLEFRMQ